VEFERVAAFSRRSRERGESRDGKDAAVARIPPLRERDDKPCKAGKASHWSGGRYAALAGSPKPGKGCVNTLLFLMSAIAGAGRAQPVLTYHGSPDRRGNFIVPSLAWERARSLHLDPGFQPRFPGHVYSQPLYWQLPGSQTAMLIVATEDDGVHAIDARSGNEIWAQSLGRPVPLSTQPCGNIDPLGITGTPVIDESTQAVYLDAMVGDASGPHHRIFALSLKGGSTLPGWPIDVADALAARGPRFHSRFQNQRGALTILDGRVYVPFGGHFGDCGDYRGWVIGIRLQDPHDIVTWSTRGRGGGIWAPGGISSDRRSLFVATGNTIDATAWSDDEAVLRLTAAPRRH